MKCNVCSHNITHNYMPVVLCKAGIVLTGICCRYTWTCSVFLSRGRLCFVDDSLDSVLLPQSTETAGVIRPLIFSGRQLRSDANDFLFTLTVWKHGWTPSSTTQLLSSSRHSAGDRSISEAQLE